MSVTLIRELMDTGGGNETGGKRSHTRLFRILTDDPYDNTATIFANRDVGPDILPKANDSFPGDVAAKCKNVAIRRIGPEEWEATCPYEYVGDTVNMGAGIFTSVPWELPPYNISTSSFAVNRAMRKAYKEDDTDARETPSVAILDSAGYPFDPPLTYLKYFAKVKFTYNLQTFNLDWQLDYPDTVNKTPLAVLDISVPKKCALIQSLNANRVVVKSETDEYHYWAVDVELAISRDGFHEEPANIGFHFLEGGIAYAIRRKLGVLGKWLLANGKPDPASEQITDPVPLNANGGIATIPSGGTVPEPSYKKFYVKYAANWDVLNLPKSMDV